MLRLRLYGYTLGSDSVDYELRPARLKLRLRLVVFEPMDNITH